MNSCHDRCLSGLETTLEKVSEYVDSTLMVVTALNPHIGYDSAAKIAKTAFTDGSTLKEAAVKLGLLTAEEYDKYVKLEEMV
jgi:fumarate hydratase class II